MKRTSHLCVKSSDDDKFRFTLTSQEDVLYFYLDLDTRDTNLPLFYIAFSSVTNPCETEHLQASELPSFTRIEFVKHIRFEFTKLRYSN